MIELLALTPVFKRPIVFGLVSGLLVSTVGLWLESFWIDAVYHYPWPASIWPEALMMAVPVTVLTGACGAMLGMVLTGQRLPGRAIGIGLVALTVVVIGGATANGLRYEVPQNATATMTLTEVPGSPDRRMVTADVRINPPDLISEDPNGVGRPAGWARQRPRHLHRPFAEARTRPLPLHPADARVREVEDTAAGARRPHPDRRAGLFGRRPGNQRAGGAAQPSMTRPFVSEITILQRERKPDTPMVLWTVGGLVVLTPGHAS